MPARLALIALSLLMAATASSEPLTGFWKSDRDLPLLGMDKSATLTLGQREMLSPADLFDRMAEIRGDREIEFLLAERSASPSYRTVATGSDFVQVEYDDAGAAEPFPTRLRSHGGLVDAPVEDMGFHGIFRRIDAPAVLAR